MPTVRDMRYRQIHLDFHTSPLIADVCRDFDAEAFADTMQAAHVNAVNVFAKCHHGMSYYPTRVGAVHPALTFDLLGAQLDALHRRSIRAPIYLTCVWDNHMAELHPDWRQRNEDGTPVGAQDDEPGWKWICLNSPYLDYQLAQTNELLDAYEVDGFWYDIVMQNDEGCWCDRCRGEMQANGLDIGNLDDRRAHNLAVVRRFEKALSDLVRARKPDATVFYNGRLRQTLGGDAPFMTQCEVESLPTSSFWGYDYYPFWVRHARTFGKPTIGMTGRFQRMWADFGGLKPVSGLKFEMGGMLANGSECCIGDQLHPRGVLSPAVYRAVGEAFAHVRDREQWCVGAAPMAEVALVLLRQSWVIGERTPADNGAARMLMELHHQFDIVDADADWSRYKLLVMADEGAPRPGLAARLSQFLQEGRALLFTHRALLDPTTGDFALPELGVRHVETCPWQPAFLRPDEGLAGDAAGFEWAAPGGASHVEAAAGTDCMGEVLASYFNRTADHFTSHGYSPHTDPTGHPACVVNGRIGYLAAPVFGDYHTYGDRIYRIMVGRIMDRLLPEPLVRTDARTAAEVTVTQIDRSFVVHVVNYQANRQGDHHPAVEEVAPLLNVSIGLRIDGPFAGAVEAPSGDPLPITYRDGRAWVVLPRVEEHGMAVFHLE